jgi:hypothetical protein
MLFRTGVGIREDACPEDEALSGVWTSASPLLTREGVPVISSIITRERAAAEVLLSGTD